MHLHLDFKTPGSARPLKLISHDIYIFCVVERPRRPRTARACRALAGASPSAPQPSANYPHLRASVHTRAQPSPHPQPACCRLAGYTICADRHGRAAHRAVRSEPCASTVKDIILSGGYSCSSSTSIRCAITHPCSVRSAHLCAHMLCTRAFTSHAPTARHG